MASACEDDTARCRPVSATYSSLYKWPESDTRRRNPRVVDSVSCRQLYLRSYKFSRKESVSVRTKKCLGKVRMRVLVAHKRIKVAHVGGGGGDYRRRKCVVIRRVKEVSCAAFSFVFRRLLSCTTKDDVVG